MLKTIEAKVYPSDHNSISVLDDEDYGGAHTYYLNKCLGFQNGSTKYNRDAHIVQFVQKDEDGTIHPGVQSEQLLLMLLDRHEKLNAKYPSEQHAQFVKGIKMALDAQMSRVIDRENRGIMGELKK